VAAERDDRLARAGELLRLGHVEPAFAGYVDVADSFAAAGNHARAAGILREFACQSPGHIPALVKLVQVTIAGGLETMLSEAQELLADAYLGAGRADEARRVAEVLVAREPWNGGHLERFRRSLLMLKVPDPDLVIADRLSGNAPFVATDVAADAGGGANRKTETETGG
jgi:hypothetical protein